MSSITTMVRGSYDIQKLRIMTGNRLVGNFKVKLGQEPGEGEDTLDEVSKNLLAQLRADDKKITSGVVDIIDDEHKSEGEEVPGVSKKAAKILSELLDINYRKYSTKADGIVPKSRFTGNAVISDYTELCLLDQYKSLEKQEARHFRGMAYTLEDYPIYTEFLSKIKGIGPAMAGVIVSEIDITKAKYSSSLWAYAGLDVAPDGSGRSRKKESLVQREYVDKDGHVAVKAGITFNPFLKTKLMGVLSGSFLRAGNERYGKVYADYKNRLENTDRWKERTKGHRHNAALRYMIKQFLVDLYVAWREIEGLEVHSSYQEAKLGHVHKAA
jgi:hypothetical protein